eukprot:6208465-Pleurochrysis_carterae.AAC.2
MRSSRPAVLPRPASLRLLRMAVSNRIVASQDNHVTIVRSRVVRQTQGRWTDCHCKVDLQRGLGTVGSYRPFNNRQRLWCCSRGRCDK